MYVCTHARIKGKILETNNIRELLMYTHIGMCVYLCICSKCTDLAFRDRVELSEAWAFLYFSAKASFSCLNEEADCTEETHSTYVHANKAW